MKNLTPKIILGVILISMVCFVGWNIVIEPSIRIYNIFGIYGVAYYLVFLVGVWMLVMWFFDLIRWCVDRI